MLDLFGREFVIESCVSALNKKRQEDNYRVYLTEVLRAISKCVGCQINYSYADMLNSYKPQKEERTPEEIISNIKGRLEAMTNGLK